MSEPPLDPPEYWLGGEDEEAPEPQMDPPEPMDDDRDGEGQCEIREQTE